MQPPISEVACEPATPTVPMDRRSGGNRRNANLAVTSYVVVLNLGPAHRAELVNVSNAGIAVQIRELHPNAAVGRAIEVIYRGNRHAGEIRHITENERGFLVGLLWKQRTAQEKTVSPLSS